MSSGSDSSAYPLPFQDLEAWRVFPPHRLPSRFLLSLDDPPDPPAIPEPSATLVLIRDGIEGSSPEVLLLKRNPRSGFIPGAWVFPGGRVDSEDRGARIRRKLERMPEEEAIGRFQWKEEGPPPLAFWIAAIRETFEETGILLGRPPDPEAAFSGGSGQASSLSLSRKMGLEHPEGGSLSRGQAALLSGRKSFADVLDMRGQTLDPRDLRYIGHWLTPESEPRRYDTRFFIAQVERGVEVRPHEKEMVDHLWLTSAEALIRNRTGSFPLVFPTLMTLEELLPFPTAAEAVDTLGTRPVPRRLPVPERAPGGIRFRIPGPAAPGRV